MTVVLGVAFTAVLLGVIALSMARVMPQGTLLAVRLGAGLALVAAAVWALVARQIGIALGLGGLALAVLRPVIAARRATPASGGRSEIETAHLDMTLDHDSGTMDGTVKTGGFAGRRLSDLSTEELLALLDEVEGDADSAALLSAYLERRGEGDAEAPPTDSGTMSEEQALRVLGLAPGATLDEIRAAHRRLIKRVHPDLGGTPALAALLNAAKHRLDPGPSVHSPRDGG